MIQKSADLLKAKIQETKIAGKIPSLFQMSQMLGISKGGLSRVLSGDLVLSRKRASQISQKLSFSELERDVLLSLIELESENNPDRKQQLLANVNSKIAIWKRNQGITSKGIPSETAYAIVCHLRMGLKYPTVMDWAKAIQSDEANTAKAIQELRDHGWVSGSLENLIMIQDRTLVDANEVKDSPVPIYKKLLKRIEDHLDNDLPERRAIGSESLLIDAEQIPELRKLTHEYLDKVAALSVNAKNPTKMIHTLAAAVVVMDRERNSL